MSNDDVNRDPAAALPLEELDGMTQTEADALWSRVRAALGAGRTESITDAARRVLSVGYSDSGTACAVAAVVVESVQASHCVGQAGWRMLRRAAAKIIAPVEATP